MADELDVEELKKLEAEAEEEKEALKGLRDSLRANPGGVARLRAKAIQDAIEGRGHEPIKRRQAGPGRVSMFEHLRDLKRAYDTVAKVGTVTGPIKQKLELAEEQLRKVDEKLSATRARLEAKHGDR